MLAFLDWCYLFHNILSQAVSSWNYFTMEFYGFQNSVFIANIVFFLLYLNIHNFFLHVLYNVHSFLHSFISLIGCNVSWSDIQTFLLDLSLLVYVRIAKPTTILPTYKCYSIYTIWGSVCATKDRTAALLDQLFSDD